MQIENNSNELINSIEEYLLSKNIKFYEYKHFCNFQKIGTGSFGKVYRANWKYSKQPLALKSFNNFNNAIVKELAQEVINMQYVFQVWYKSFIYSINNLV